MRFKNFVMADSRYGKWGIVKQLVGKGSGLSRPEAVIYWKLYRNYTTTQVYNLCLQCFDMVGRQEEHLASKN